MTAEEIKKEIRLLLDKMHESQLKVLLNFIQTKIISEDYQLLKKLAN